MQTALSTPSSSTHAGAAPMSGPGVQAGSAGSALANYQIIRRNGAVVPFEPSKIAVALMKAFLAVHGTQGAASASVRETVDGLTQAVVRALQHPANQMRDLLRDRRSVRPSVDQSDDVFRTVEESLDA